MMRRGRQGACRASGCLSISGGAALPPSRRGTSFASERVRAPGAANEPARRPAIWRREVPERMLRDESNPGGESGPRAAAVTPIVLVVGAGRALADLARTLGDAGYPVITVPHARQLAGLAAGGSWGPSYSTSPPARPAVVEWLRRAVAAAGGLVIGVRGDLDERERRRLRRRFGLFAIHDPRDGLEHFLDLVDTAVDVGRDQHRRRAEHAVRVNLLAKLCHDLRSNLSVITGYADVLGDDAESTATARGALAGLRKASRQSHELVETYSALAHCDSERMEDRRETVDVRKVVAALRRHVEIRSRYAPCALLVDPPPPAAVHTDREKLHAMLTHLVDAALKRSPEGDGGAGCGDGERPGGLQHRQHRRRRAVRRWGDHGTAPPRRRRRAVRNARPDPRGDDRAALRSAARRDRRDALAPAPASCSASRCRLCQWCCARCRRAPRTNPSATPRRCRVRAQRPCRGTRASPRRGCARRAWRRCAAGASSPSPG